MSDERYDALLDELRDEDLSPPDDLSARLGARLSTTVARGAAGLAAAELASEVLTEMGREGGAAAAGMVSTKVAIWMTLAGVAVGGAGGALTYHAVAGDESPSAPIVAPVVADAGPIELDAGTALDAGPADAGIDGGVEVEEGEPAEVAPTVEASRRRERVLLRQAQSALVRDRPGDALDALRRHTRLFPESTFAEERDALEVQALAGAGRADEAARKAAAFEATHPGSIFLPRVRAAVR
ncbi:MAG: hypothetical protein JJ863_18305 [Deltaproteobacteria bacterium]|nr:hypothetical protein [Deltaproteobacteria bacterium]